MICCSVLCTFKPVVCIMCPLMSILMKVWLAKPSREEKAEVIANLLSDTTSAPTTAEDITRMLVTCEHISY